MSELKPFKCRKCKAEIARTDGERIYFGPAPVPLNPRRIVFLCPHCKAQLEWLAKIAFKPIPDVV